MHKFAQINDIRKGHHIFPQFFFQCPKLTHALATMVLQSYLIFHYLDYLFIFGPRCHLAQSSINQMCLTSHTVIYSATVRGNTSFASIKMETRGKTQSDVSKKQFRQLFAESLLESPVSLTDEAAIPARNLFSTECNQQNKHKIILLATDCCVGT